MPLRKCQDKYAKRFRDNSTGMDHEKEGIVKYLKKKKIQSSINNNKEWIILLIVWTVFWG